MSLASSERSAGRGDDAAPPRVVAVVVSYNSALDLPLCLAALRSQRGVSVETHVVDNASSDGSIDRARREFPDVRFEVNARNVGFARANNQALERGGAAAYALVNPDAFLPADALAVCVERFGRDPTIGVVATRLVNPDGSLQPSCHSFLGLGNLLGETLGLHRLLPALRSLNSLDMPWFAHDAVAEVDWIQGAFLVVRGETIRAVGAFDPAFFMYGEEMDFCRRARKAGWKVLFLPEPPVVHVGGASSKPIAGPMFIENLKGRIRFLHKHRGPLVAFAARVLIGTSVLLRLAWRETQGFLESTASRPRDETLRLKRTMFRAAAGWVLRGLPLSPPDLGPASGRS